MPDFPDDVWILVLKCLQFTLPLDGFNRQCGACGPANPSDSIKALSRISRTSRRLHKLTQPLLYRALPGGYSNSCEHLLQSLVEHEHLAKVVREMDLTFEGTLDALRQTLQDCLQIAQQRRLIPEGVITHLQASLSGEEDKDEELITDALARLVYGFATKFGTD